uniref:Uncharacterized protein n=1 Tax=Cucumis melo TaxID=3656 RepID=A0A9I9E3D6_CUCME
MRGRIKRIKAEIRDSEIEVSLRLRGNQTPNQGCLLPSKFKIPEPKAFNGNRDPTFKLHFGYGRILSSQWNHAT